jgi:hypothetical protein
MEAAYRDRDAGHSERSRDVERARVLIGLHADKHNQAKTGVPLKAADERTQVNVCIGLVDNRDVDPDIWPEHLPLSAIGRNTIQSCERIRRYHRTPPTDHIAIVVIVRRFYENELEAASAGHEDPFGD